MTVFLPTVTDTAIDTYSDLVTQVKKWADDLDDEDACIDVAIVLTEARFNRELRTDDMLTEHSLVMTSETGELPDDFLQMQRNGVNDHHGRPMSGYSSAGLIQQYQRRNGTPVAYAIEGRRVRVAPVGDTTLEILYYAKIPGLSADNSTNWLLQRHPDAYLAGVMTHCEKFIDDPRLVQEWKAAWDQWLYEIKKDAERNKWGTLTPVGVQQVRGAVC